MQQTYEATLYWSVEGGPSGAITLRRGFLTADAARKGARRYVREQGVLGSVTIVVTEM